MSQPTVFVVLGLAVLAGLAASLLTGPAEIGVWSGLRALLVDQGGPETIVMREIRAPRAVLGLAIGASLGLAGAAMQGLLRNPLAEPGLIGISASAALGAVLALQTGIAATVTFALPAAALAGAGLAAVLLFTLGGVRGTTVTLILAGVAVSALAGAATSLVLNLSPNPFAASEIVFWLLGSLADRSWEHVALALPVMAVGWVCLALTGRGLDALTLGEDAAQAMGISLGRLRLLAVAGVAAAVGAATAVAGAIGFIGLIVPHLLRKAAGGAPGRLLPLSALGGAALLLFADVAVRVILPERDLKLGVLTALVGAPFFLHLVLRLRREGA